MFQTRGLEIVVIAIVVFVLFGAKRLPDSARALGRSLRIFKAETQAMRDEDARSAGAARQDGQAGRPPREVPSGRAEPVVVKGHMVEDDSAASR